MLCISQETIAFTALFCSHLATLDDVKHEWQDVIDEFILVDLLAAGAEVFEETLDDGFAPHVERG